MDDAAKLIYETKKLLMLRYPRFGNEIAAANISFRDNLKYHTAATDGKNIYIDSEYFASLNESDRVFIIAHELMHIKFEHVYRLADKDGNKRNLDIWNIATDAIINANLERDGFTIQEGYVNKPEALMYSAEEFYQLLLEEKKAKEEEEKNKKQTNQENGNSQEQSSDQNGQPSDNMNNNEQQKNEGDGSKGQDDSQNSEPSEESEYTADDHSLWEEAFEKSQNKDESKDNDNSSNEKKSEDKGKDSSDDNKQVEEKREQKTFDEREEFSSNREERKARAKEKMEQMKRQFLSGFNSSDKINLGAVGESSDEIDWKLLLRREIDKTETVWSQRRSIAENNYAYRLEEYDIEDDAETEVMIDVSGSVDLELVRAFLRVIKPILRESKLKVGCFNEKFWGMKNIERISDIDNFEIPEGARGSSAWTEDWDLAVRSFSKKREVNKIVFTDGYPCPGTMPKEDLRHENVIWLVYGNKSFNPCCGNVIMITSDQLEELHESKLDFDFESKRR